MFKDIPNILTIVRIGLIPVLVVSFYLDGVLAHYIATSIFVFASITDYFDGILARYLKAQSNFGRMLDPIADKMLVSSTLLMLVDRKMAPVFPIIAILCREIFVSGMREYLAEQKVKMPVNFLGKLKTVVQMIAIIVLLLGEEGSGISYANEIGQFSIWFAAALTIISGYVYVKEGVKHILIKTE